jgi:hypothetical protein
MRMKGHEMVKSCTTDGNDSLTASDFERLRRVHGSHECISSNGCGRQLQLAGRGCRSRHEVVGLDLARVLIISLGAAPEPGRKWGA